MPGPTKQRNETRLKIEIKIINLNNSQNNKKCFNQRKRPPSPQWPSWHSADLAPALRPKQPRHPPKMRNQSQPRGEEERLTKKPPRRRRRRRQRRWRRQRRQERPRNVAAQKVRTREKKRPLAFFGEIFSAALKLKTTFSAKPFREKLFSLYPPCCSLPMDFFPVTP